MSMRNAILLALVLITTSLAKPATGKGPEKHFENSVGMTFALVPAGDFMMGSPPGESHRDRDETQHRVTIAEPFYMQTTEVTLGQWWAVMGKKFFGRRKGNKNDPVVKVSWFDCHEFIEKLNRMGDGTYRLPTEAEWEYACRAGTKSAYGWGSSIDCSKALYSNNPLKSSDCVEYAESKGIQTDGAAPVKSYAPNNWGLYDMHGNVWEWCEDWYGAYPKTPRIDPKGPERGTDRIRRGGSWFKYGWYCRSANRNKGHPGSKYDTLGFRVVREVP